MRRLLAAALLVPLVAAGAEPDARAILRARLATILPDESWRPDGALPVLTALSAHEAALRADPDHGNAFFVEEVHGRPDARRVVFLVPQLHRSPVLPVAWASLGEVITQVQSNIDFLTTRLVHAHRVRCLGTEGSGSDVVRGSPEVEELAAWLVELRAHRDAVIRQDPALRVAAERLVELLTPILRRHALMLDGVGVALARLEVVGSVPPMLVRFGLEDAALNARALKLLGRMRPLEEKLALLTAPAEEDGEDALGQMWRDEYPAFARDVVTPVRQALATLDAARLARVREDDAQAAQALGRLTTLSRKVTDELLRVDEIESYHRYYQELAARRGEARKPQGAPPLTAAEKRRQRALEDELNRLTVAYEKVSGADREAAAVRRTLARLPAHGACALVMGANHREGLVRELRAQGGPDVGVIVVTPYQLPDDEAATPDGGP